MHSEEYITNGLNKLFKKIKFMRLGEIRNILWEVLTEQNQISIDHESIYEGRANNVNNYGPLIDALDILSKQSWNDIGYAEIDAIKKEFGTGVMQVQLPQDKFNQLNAYISALNSKLPFFVSILETMVEDQEEHVINIKLPDSIKNLADLTNFNQASDKLFKSFQIDGQFEFRSFDKGTSWYEIIIIGELTYRYFIASLKIAQEYYKLKSEYFKSKEAQISFEAAKQNTENLTQQNYQKEWLEQFIKQEIKLLVEEKIKETNGESEESLENKLVIATKGLVEALGEGTEFHLSLNPPEYATEQAGQLIIDYKNIKSLKTEDKPRQIAEHKKIKDESNEK